MGGPLGAKPSDLGRASKAGVITLETHRGGCILLGGALSFSPAPLSLSDLFFLSIVSATREITTIDEQNEKDGGQQAKKPRTRQPQIIRQAKTHDDEKRTRQTTKKKKRTTNTKRKKKGTKRDQKTKDNGQTNAHETHETVREPRRRTKRRQKRKKRNDARVQAR